MTELIKDVPKSDTLFKSEPPKKGQHIILKVETYTHRFRIREHIPKV
jgi:hypothetical protein